MSEGVVFVIITMLRFDCCINNGVLVVADARCKEEKRDRVVVVVLQVEASRRDSGLAAATVVKASLRTTF